MTEQAPWSPWISEEIILGLQRDAINEHGGMHGIRDSGGGCVERCLGAAYNAQCYNESDEGIGLSVLNFTGCLLFYLTEGNCFIDGNKRIGWAAAMRVLLTNGLTVNASIDEAEELCMGIVEGTVKSSHEVTMWLAERVTAIEGLEL